jgi:4-diphosphocytidyl-2-C-methyl-D-erythritol kinase
VKTLERLSGCKINLLLNILGRREDGFHELETVLHPVNVFDRIEFAVTGTSVELSCDVPRLACDESNLVMRAAREFFRASQIAAGVRIRLFKKIPLEAGLGGGSGNAATTLLGLNHLFDRPLDDARLRQVAASLGSDVPFFLQTQPALATGRGETIEALDPLPQLAGRVLLLVHPEFGVSTPWAYRALARFPGALNGRRGRARELIAALRAVGEPTWGAKLHNSLVQPAFSKFPILNLYVRHFIDLGALGALMSGSGSSVFAWFTNRIAAEKALDRFHCRFGAAAWSAVVD